MLDEFDETLRSTIGYESEFMNMTMSDGTEVKLQFIDTAGQVG